MKPADFRCDSRSHPSVTACAPTRTAHLHACALSDGTRVQCLELGGEHHHCALALDATANPCTAVLPDLPLGPAGRRLTTDKGAAGAGPPGLGGLTALALATVLQNLLGANPLGQLAACPNPFAPVPQEDEVTHTAHQTAVGAFGQSGGAAQLLSPTGAAIATFVDGQTATDPTSATGELSAIPGHALDLLTQALAGVPDGQAHLALVVTQAEPNAPLTFDAGLGVWTIGAALAGDAGAFQLAGLMQADPASLARIRALVAQDAALHARGRFATRREPARQLQRIAIVQRAFELPAGPVRDRFLARVRLDMAEATTLIAFLTDLPVPDVQKRSYLKALVKSLAGPLSAARYHFEIWRLVNAAMVPLYALPPERRPAYFERVRRYLDDHPPDYATLTDERRTP